MMDIKTLQLAKETAYKEHVAEVSERYQQLLDQHGYDAVLIHSGGGENFFRDDQQKNYRINPYFLHWLPLDQHLNCFLLVQQTGKPILFYYRAQDYWHQPLTAPTGHWSSQFEVVEFSDSKVVLNSMQQSGEVAFIGEAEELAKQWGMQEINPQPFLAAVDWYRSFKTEYEILCLKEASSLAVQGHAAVESALGQGVSEFGLLMAYLNAVGQREEQLPYGSIIALNEHASVLHYQHYQRQAPEELNSLLIDAGARVNGYGSDITRTYSTRQGVFNDLIVELDAIQRGLISNIEAGNNFIDLHQQVCLDIASLLQHCGIVSADPEKQLEESILTAFFPHGLGHLLGIQVHDSAGQQVDQQGTPAVPPTQFPHLRLTRKLQPGMVFTIEPGIYFIEQLLNPLKKGKSGQLINWKMVEALMPCGGIRIEDNIHLAKNGPQNLTREAFSSAN